LREPVGDDGSDVLIHGHIQVKVLRRDIGECSELRSLKQGLCIDAYIREGISIRSRAIIQGAVYSARLKVSHLGSVHATGCFVDLYPAIDSQLGTADFAHLNYSSSGPAIMLVMACFNYTFQPVRKEAARLLQAAGRMGNMQLLIKLDRLHTMFIDAQALFQTSEFRALADISPENFDLNMPVYEYIRAVITHGFPQFAGKLLSRMPLNVRNWVLLNANLAGDVQGISLISAGIAPTR